MSFLNPQFLFALFAVLIPILIHFFNLQRPRKVLFPNVRFLKEVQQSASNRLKLKHILILLARIGFVVFLVFAFSQPYWNATSTKSSKGGKSVVEVFVDNSYSMQVEGEEGKAFDQSLNSALKLPDVYPSNTKFQVITNDFEGKDGVFRGKENFTDRLAELRYSGGSRNASEILSRASKQASQSDADRKHVYWFSDFQNSTFDPAAIAADTSITYYLLPMQVSNIHNVFVDTAWMTSPVIRENENVELKCKIKNSGSSAAKDLQVKLMVDGIQLSAQSITLEAEASTELSFTFAVQGRGYKKAEIRLDDQPVNFDNQYYLSFKVSPQVKVLHLYGKDPVLGRVYSGEPMFNLTSRPVGDFNYAQIEQSNLVVLENIKDIPEALINPLKEFCEKGGSVALVPAPDANLSSYQKFLTTYGVSGLTIEPLDTSKRAASQLAVPDFKHPFYSDFFERVDNRLLMPYAFPVLAFPAKGQALLRYKDGKNYLSRIPYQKGDCYIFTSGLQSTHTDFTRHSLLVPIFYKIAFWSIHQTDQLSYFFSQHEIETTLDFPVIKNVELVYGDRRIIPGQRVANGKLILDIEEENMPAGFYELRYQDSVVKVLAFNPDKSESIMKFASKEELGKLTEKFPNIKIIESSSVESFVSTIKAQSIGIPLWRYCIMLCLVFLLIETLLIRYFRQKQEPISLQTT